MRALPWLLLLAVVLTPAASAETYRIGGQATYSDNTPVMLRDVYVECPQGRSGLLPLPRSERHHGHQRPIHGGHRSG